MRQRPLALFSALLLLPFLALMAASCRGSDSKSSASPTTSAALPTAADSGRLPGPRLFEALAQSSEGTILVQVDLSGLVHIQFEDAQAVNHAKNCHAEGAASFKDMLAAGKNLTPVNTKLPPEAAASLLGMYQLTESGGLERLVFAGTGQGPISDEDRTAISRFLAAVAAGCRP